MSINITLLTNLNVLDELHKLADKSGKTCKIETEILQRLLLDHSVMFRAIRESSSIQIKEPKNREKI